MVTTALVPTLIWFCSWSIPYRHTYWSRFSSHQSRTCSANPAHANPLHLGYNWLLLALTQAVTFSISRWVISRKSRKQWHAAENTLIWEGRKLTNQLFSISNRYWESYNTRNLSSSTKRKPQGRRKHWLE